MLFVIVLDKYVIINYSSGKTNVNKIAVKSTFIVNNTNYERLF